MGSLAKKICSVEGCSRKYSGKGYCNLHYQRYIRHGNPLTVLVNTEHGGKCSFEGCSNKYRSNGFCDMHYWRWKHNDDPAITQIIHNYGDKICSVENCDKRPRANNMCNAHYQRLNIYGDPLYPMLRDNQHPESCSVEGCNRPYSTKGYCDTHYSRYKKKGSVQEGIEVATREIHGLSYTSEQRSWNSMLQRCYNPKVNQYHNYGGRGIKVCNGWRNSLLAFYQDMGEKPTPLHSIDRKNNDGHYSCGKCKECLANGWPMNCKWSTQEEQMNNTRINLMLTIDNTTMSISMWAKKYNINRNTIAYRLKIGKTLKQALGLE